MYKDLLTERSTSKKDPEVVSRTTFDGDVCKITKETMVMAYGKKECTLYMTSGFRASISVASSELDTRVWHRRLRHMSEKGMKVMLSKDKLSELKIY